MIDAISCMRLPFRIPDTALKEADKDTALSEQIVVFTWELSISSHPLLPLICLGFCFTLEQDLLTQPRLLWNLAVPQL